MAGLAVALWWQQRDPLYGCFALAALLGVVRDLDRLWPDIPVPWPAWGAIEAACYAVHLALIARFVQMAGGPLRPAMRRAINGFSVFAVVMAGLGFTLGLPALWTLVLGALIPLGLSSFAVVVRNAVFARRLSAWVLPAAGAAAVLAGTYDFLLIRLGHSSGFRVQLTPPAMFGFVIVMAGIVVQRYNRSVTDYRSLNARLVERVAEREQQLRSAFDSLREKDRLQSVADERQRIMQDIHDGVGSQLVGLLQLVRAPGADPQTLTHHVTQALDEMRIAVDSLQPAQDDLVTVLATLRHRLEPRLSAAGIALLWRVSDLPALRPMTPAEVRQVQRIVMEAFTNVLRHAGATQVIVETFQQPAPSAAVLRITDNGMAGADAGRLDGTSTGRGVSGMQRRAEAIGATIRVAAEASGGVSVTLVLPVTRAG